MMTTKPLVILDCDGPMANPQYLQDQICMHLGLPRTIVAESPHFETYKAIGCTKDQVEEGFGLSRATFTADCYHPVRESVESILTLSLFFRWMIGTGRNPPSNPAESITSRWASRVYRCSSCPIVEVHHAKGQGHLFGALKDGVDKLKLCETLNARFIVEDNPHEIAHFMQNNSSTEPICYAYGYNKSVSIDYPNVFRGNWPEITQYLLRKLG